MSKQTKFRRDVMAHIDAYTPPLPSTLFFGVRTLSPLSRKFIDEATLYFAHARLDQVPFRANRYAMALIGEINRIRRAPRCGSRLSIGAAHAKRKPKGKK